jgi:integration host factor subunit alpha
MNTTRPVAATIETDDSGAITKAQLAEMLYEQIGFNKRESKDIVEAFFEVISDRLIQGQDVKLSGFGNFQIRTKAPRPGRNPRTGEPVAIEARRVVTFHASPKLKESVQDGRWPDADQTP